MTAGDDGRKAYKIPAIVNPGTFKCVKVFIPDDPLYYGAFWNAYQFFSKQIAWERDEAHTAIQAAAVWRAAWNMSRLYWPDQEGDCDVPFQLRDDPADPCKVQQSIDGGTTWTHAFDKECAEGGTVIPPADDVAAGNLLHNLLTHVFTYLDDHYEDPGARSAFALWYCSYLDTITGDDVSCAGAANIWDAWDELTTDQRDKLLDPCNYLGAKNQLALCIGESDMLEAISCMMDSVFEAMADIPSDIMDAMQSIYDLFDGAQAEAVATLNDTDNLGGAEFAAHCVEADGCVDLKVTDGGFDVNTYGVWNEGLGWYAQLNSGMGRYELDITTTTLPTGAVGTLQVNYGFYAPGKYLWIYINGTQVLYQEGGPAGYRSALIEVNGVIDSLRVKMWQGTLNSGTRLNSICFLP